MIIDLGNIMTGKQNYTAIATGISAAFVTNPTEYSYRTHRQFQLLRAL